MKKVAGLILAGALMLSGQEAAKVPQTKVVRLQHVDSKRVFNLLSVTTPGRMSVDGDLIVLTGSPEVVAIMEGLIRQIDIPPAAMRSVEISTYMLLGVNEAGDSKVPAELAGVVKQLRDTFPFSGYRLLETMYIRASENRGGETSGLMPGPGPVSDAMPKAIYQCRFNSVRVEEAGGGRRIVLNGLRFGTKVPYATGKDGYQYADLGANIDSVSVREGQKAVIGKAGVGPGKESLFLVLSARVVD